MNQKDIQTVIDRRKSDGNKGTNGFLTVVAGSNLYRGAAGLCVGSALRCGVGIVRLASVEKVIAAVSSKISECIFMPLDENEGGSISFNSFCKMKPTKKSTAVLAGCGMTDCTDTKEIVTSLICDSDVPLVLDADALNTISHCPEILCTSKAPIIITPHIGEMSRLCGRSCDEIKSDRVGVAVEFAKKYNVTVVLKDYVTVILSPSGETYIHDCRNSGLSKGGSGDVLSGMIASLAAQGIDIFDSARIGVVIHSMAGKIAAMKYTEVSMLPSDVINCISDVFAEMSDNK